MQRAIPGTNEQLMINERGVVTSYRRRQPKVLKHTFIKTSRYPWVRIEENKRKSILQLVAQLFVVNPDPERFNIAILIDQNPDNICPENIKWITKSYMSVKNTRIRDGVKRKYTSEFHGVSRDHGSWVAQLTKNGVNYRIGSFPTQREARNARLRFEADHPELLDN